MKIISFGVNNFRGLSGGLKQNTIEFRDTNTLFIFGQNNTGKSTFLKAYLLFYSDTMLGKEDHFRQDLDNEIQFQLEVEIDEYDHLRIEAAAPTKKDSYKKYLIDGKNLRLQSIFNKNDSGKIVNSKYTFNPEISEFEKNSYASIGLHQVFQSCMPKPILIKAMPKEDEVKKILNEILKSVAESKLKIKELQELQEAKETIQKLQDKMYNSESIQSYESSINAYFEQLFPDTKISIKDMKSRVVWSENKLGKEFDIEFNKINESEIDPTIPTSISTTGHGTIRTAIFTLLLMRDIAEEFEREKGRKDYLVLFEEPELFLYPKIVQQLRSLIYQVSEDDLPYQVLCASHSPQMIDLSKPKSSIIRLVKEGDSSSLFQINDKFLKNAIKVTTDKQLKQEMYEILRFNPFICESFYADEIILIEGPTEEIIIRAYVQEKTPDNYIFILNCGTVNNIPFFQKIFSKFSINYNIICDTDGIEIKEYDDEGNPSFISNIQKSISDQFNADKLKDRPNNGIFRTHNTTFEPAHQSSDIPEKLRFNEGSSLGKPYNANCYWKNVLLPNIDHPEILKVPILRYCKEIFKC